MGSRGKGGAVGAAMMWAMAVAALVAGGGPASAMPLGLQGEFWNTGDLRDLGAARAAIAAGPADATFTASAIDYPRGAQGSGSSAAALSAFLADDAASLIGDGAAALGGSVFRFTGFLALEGGARMFSVGSDDGFRLSVGGETVLEHAGLRSFRTSTATRDLGSGWLPMALIYFENRGRTGVEFRIDGAIVAGERIAAAPPAAIPLPAASALMIGALTALAWVSARRRAAQG